MQKYDANKDDNSEGYNKSHSLYFMDKYRIPSARKPDCAYAGGTYFVTICNKNREWSFGHIVEDANGTKSMIPTDMGKYADQMIRDMPLHNPYASVPLWVVMPNHVHLIVIIDGEKTPYRRREIVGMRETVETRHATPTVETRHATSLQMREIANMQGWLSVAVSGFKSAVTKYAGNNHIDFEWQTRFYDHIIRSQEEMNQIAEYIYNNVAKWDEDCFNVKP